MKKVFIQPITEPVEPDTRVDTASVAKKVTATMQALATLALAFAFASYIGFGATAIYGEENKNRARTGVSTVIFAAGSWAAVSGLGARSRQQWHSSHVSRAISAITSPWTRAKHSSPTEVPMSKPPIQRKSPRTSDTAYSGSTPNCPGCCPAR